MNDGPNSLWSLAYKLCEEKIHATEFLKEWKLVEDKVTINDLRAKPLEGPNKDKSLFWLVLNALLHEKERIFLGTRGKIVNKILEKFFYELTMDDLRDSDSEGRSILLLFAALTLRDHNSYFINIWKQFKKEIQMHDLLTARPNYLSPLCVLMLKASCDGFGCDIVRDILQHTPGHLPDDILESFPGKKNLNYPVIVRYVNNRLEAQRDAERELRRVRGRNFCA